MIPRILLVFVALAVTGCGVVYTSIRQETDGSYILTGTHSGFFRINGEVYRCSPEGENMKCQLTSDN